MKIQSFALSLLASVVFLTSTTANAQNPANKSMSASKKDERPSPPMVAKANIGGNLEITINYSSPAVKGRKIFGDLVPYGQVWRTGANETTTIEVNRDCKLSGNGLKKGRYALFTIPGENEWTIILNTDADGWGAYKYNKDKDVFRFTAQPQKSSKFYERFTIEISDEGMISLNWENTTVAFQIY
jgi:hypothetical protein